MIMNLSYVAGFTKGGTNKCEKGTLFLNSELEGSAILQCNVSKVNLKWFIFHRT